MYSTVIQSGLFRHGYDDDISHEAMLDLVNYNVSVNERILRKFSGVPSLLQSNVIYYAPDCTPEVCFDTPLRDIAALLETGEGDCKSLASYVVAWKRVRERRVARVEIDYRMLDATTREYHVWAAWKNGARWVREDPSQQLISMGRFRTDS